MISANWPSFYPLLCPPAQADDAAAEVFRLVHANPPSSGDFESWAKGTQESGAATAKPPGSPYLQRNRMRRDW
jgi:hypothetical protein